MWSVQRFSLQHMCGHLICVCGREESAGDKGTRAVRFRSPRAYQYSKRRGAFSHLHGGVRITGSGHSTDRRQLKLKPQASALGGGSGPFSEPRIGA